LAEDPQSRELARQIQAEGFDVALMVEATVALHRRDLQKSPEANQADATDSAPPLFLNLETQGEIPEEHSRPSMAWSEEDKAFLRKFKISLE
jgi:hypothetical protein